jgi:hypothetical protein
MSLYDGNGGSHPAADKVLKNDGDDHRRSHLASGQRSEESHGPRVGLLAY